MGFFGLNIFSFSYNLREYVLVFGVLLFCEDVFFINIYMVLFIFYVFRVLVVGEMWFLFRGVYVKVWDRCVSSNLGDNDFMDAIIFFSVLEFNFGFVIYWFYDFCFSF